MPEHDAVNHPRHYASHPRFTIECIELTRLMTFDAGNCLKYLWRFEQKNGGEDLRKAVWYLTDLLRNDGQVWSNTAAGVRGQLLFEKHVKPYVDRSNAVDRTMVQLAYCHVLEAATNSADLLELAV